MPDRTPEQAIEDVVAHAKDVVLQLPVEAHSETLEAIAARLKQSAAGTQVDGEAKDNA